MKEVLKWNGKIIYDPETGEPIDKKDFDEMMKIVGDFVESQTATLGENLIFGAVATQKVLERLAKWSSCEEMQKLVLDKIKYRNRSFDFLRANIKTLESIAHLTNREKAAYQAASDWSAQLVTEADDAMKNEVKKVVLEGIKNRQSKQIVSQNLFNALMEKNRNWRRIANTETVNAANLATCLEEVASSPKGEKVYFKRYELAGCCPQCQKADGTVVLWSDKPLADDRIKDDVAKVAIWEGKDKAWRKNQMLQGCLHPNCRGGWRPWSGGRYDAMDAMIEERSKKWDAAIKEAKKLCDPPYDDRNKMFVEKINEIYKAGGGK